MAMANTDYANSDRGLGIGVDAASAPMRRSRSIALDARLSVIAEMVGARRLYADIGCDHGRLGAYLLKSGQCRHAVLTDISEESLKKARQLITLMGLNDRVDFGVGDGADAIVGRPEAVVIAGMGGATIARIVREGRARLGDAALILQPNVAERELRAALIACRYRICDERIASDNRRHYVVIAAVPGTACCDARELVIGPILLKRLPPEMVPYARFKARVANKALEGARRGRDAEEIEVLERECALWMEVLQCLQP